MKKNLRDIVKKAGGTVRVAIACGVSPGAVSQWMKAGSLPLSDVNGRTNHAKTLIELSGIKADEWDIRLIGRK